MSPLFAKGEGNGKSLLKSNFCLENPLQDHQKSQQTRRTTTAATTTTTTCKINKFTYWV